MINDIVPEFPQANYREPGETLIVSPRNPHDIPDNIGEAPLRPVNAHDNLEWAQMISGAH